jgi:cholesterol transport system auxiliary component
MRQLTLVLVLCVFSGCSLMTSKAPPKTEFDFGPEPIALSDSPPLSQVQLVVYDVSAPAWMDGTAMYYRLAYQNAAVPLPYAESEWVMSPAALLTERLRSSASVHADGGARLVSVHTAEVYTLHSELLEFEQIFDAPDHSHGVLRLRATLEGEGVWARRSFAIERPAPMPNAAGGVRALTECSQELAKLLEEWVSASHSRSPPSAGRESSRAAVYGE